MRRTGLGCRDALAEDAGDPLDGLVNLFDIGIVLAVAFLVAGLTLSVDARTGRVERRDERPRESQARALPSPAGAPRASGRGAAVGTVYRLDDGRLVYVEGRGGR
jgi:hypothetical protein